MPDQSIDIQGMPAYLAQPEGESRGGLIVIHEVWGLNEHTRDVARRFAAQGYLALAPDLLAGTALEGKLEPGILARAADPATRDEAQKEMRAAMAPLSTPEFGHEIIGKLRKAYAWLVDQPQAQGKVGVVGYCFGGTYAFALAAAEPELQAAVPYYGQPPQEEQVRAIHCPVLAFYGEQDTRLMESLPDLRQRMQEAGVDFQAVVYPEAGHAFFNDSNPTTYRPEAAKDAWQRTLAFLGQHLG